MNNTLKDYIARNNVCALTLIISDGGPHSSAMYYVFDRKAELFYFVADINDMKCEMLSETEPTFASFVIGMDPEEWKSLQVRGSANLVSLEEEEFVIKKHFNELDFLNNFLDSENRALIKIVPNWWKFTDAGNGSITQSD